MPYVTKLFAFAAGAEGLTDQGVSTEITFAPHVGDGDPSDCVKFTHATQGMTKTERARGALATDTWETWGVPTGSVIHSVQITAYSRKFVTEGYNAVSHALKARVLYGPTGGFSVHADDGDLIDDVLPLSVDGAWVSSIGPGPTQRVFHASLNVTSSTSGVAFELEYNAVTGILGSGTSDIRFDQFAIKIGYTPEDADELVPDADTSIGLWEDDGGGTTNIYQAVDEGDPISNSDFIVSDSGPASDTCELGLTSLGYSPFYGGLGTSDAYDFRGTSLALVYSYGKSASAGQQIDVTVKLREGTTTIVSIAHVDVSDTMTTNTRILTLVEAESIGNWDNLNVQLIANAPGGGAKRRGKIGGIYVRGLEEHWLEYVDTIPAGGGGVPVPTVTAGDVTATPSPVVTTGVVPAPTATPDPVTLTPSPVIGATVIPAPVALGENTISPSPVTAVTAFVAPALNWAAIPAAVVAATVIAALTLVPGNVSMAVSPVTAGANIPTPSVASHYTATPSPVVAATVVTGGTVVPGPVTMTPSPVAGVTVVPAPTLLNVYTATPSAVVATTVIPAPTLVAGPVSVTPSPAVAATSVPAPTLNWGITPAPAVASSAVPAVAELLWSIVPSPVVAATSIPAPTLVPGGVSMTPSPVGAATAVPAPTVLIGERRIYADAVVATTVVPAPTVPIPDRTATPSPVVAATAIPVPKVTAASFVFTPDAVTVSAVTVAPTIVAGGVTMTPIPVVAIATIPVPVVTADYIATPTPVTVIGAPAAPTIVIGTATMTPSPVAATTVIPAPVVTPGPASVSPSPVTAAAVVPAPTLVPAGVTMSPSPVATTAVVPAPVLTTGGIVVTPSPVVGATVVPAPFVILDPDRVIQPLAVVASAAIPAVTFNWAVVPGPVVAATAVPAPSFSFGGVSITPSPVTASAGIVAPALNWTVTPSPVVAPTAIPALGNVVPGNTTVTPSPAVASAVAQFLKLKGVDVVYHDLLTHVTSLGKVQSMTAALSASPARITTGLNKVQSLSVSLDKTPTRITVELRKTQSKGSS